MLNLADGFSGPSSLGGVLQWGRPEGNMRRPNHNPQDSDEEIVISERTHAALNEDPDVAPSSETVPPDAKQASCSLTILPGKAEHMQADVTPVQLRPASVASISLQEVLERLSRISLSGMQIACMHADEVNNMLWLGHKDGKVSGYLLGPSPGTPLNAKLLHQWQVRHHTSESTPGCFKTPACARPLLLLQGSQ